MSFGKKKQTIGYKYQRDLHFLLCIKATHIRKLVFGEDEGLEAWSGEVTSNTTISVDKPDLFGGEEKEGGVVGDIDVMFGGPSQTANSYMLAVEEVTTMPAWKNVVSVLFKAVYLSAITPYLKPLKWQVSNYYTSWNAGLAVINTYDSNPAHIVHECIVNRDWGMGQDPALIDSVSFDAAAQTLYDEGLGLSFSWSQENRVENFLSEVMEHIDGVLTRDLASGKFELILIREDYSLESLPVFDQDNSIKRSFETPGISEIVNEVVVVYQERDTGIEDSIAVQNLAMIEAHGGQVISETRNYLGVQDKELAMRLAERDLKGKASPLARLSFVTSRQGRQLKLGSPFKWSWPTDGIEEMVFRVVSLEHAEMDTDEITIEAVQDVFRLKDTTYMASQAPLYINPVGPPEVPEWWYVMEAPYWYLDQGLSDADLAALSEESGFLMAFSRRERGYDLGYYIYSSPDNVTYEKAGESSAFNPYFEVDGADLTNKRLDTVVHYTVAIDEDAVTEPMLAYWDGELVELTSVDSGTQELTLKRGVLDTLPIVHYNDSVLVVLGDISAIDDVEYFDGDLVYHKIQVYNGQGKTDLGDSTLGITTADARAIRPFPPGNVQINAEYYPTTVDGDLSFTWAHRDRLAQTVSLEDWTTGNIGPEAGVTYTLKLYSHDLGKYLLNLTGLTSPSYAYSVATELAAEGAISSNLTFNLFVLRDGWEARTYFSWSFTRTVEVENYDLTESPAAEFDLTQGII